MLANIRLGWKLKATTNVLSYNETATITAITNTLAYYDKTTIMSAKKFDNMASRFSMRRKRRR